MFKKYLFSVLAVTLCLILLGCGSSSPGGKVNPMKFMGSAGQATNLDFEEETRRIIVNKHHYVIVRTYSTMDQLSIETDWRYRDPLEDEVDLGIVAVRSRFFIRAIPRGRYTQGPLMYNVTVEGDNEVRFENQEAWVQNPLTPMAMKYFKGIASELKYEYETGIREYR